MTKNEAKAMKAWGDLHNHQKVEIKHLLVNDGYRLPALFTTESIITDEDFEIKNMNVLQQRDVVSSLVEECYTPSTDEKEGVSHEKPRNAFYFFS
ncbi:hypothetical protein HCA99_16810 [Listeria booriae]|uniref:hypothetical protein n=1 Tax=Listeria booriae TaxID=1552123 RepID=UPI001627516D|nr:hypothetical protein [Listeria booriae]MBC2080894.1 hypothetical protein [Listeria booriae]